MRRYGTPIFATEMKRFSTILKYLKDQKGSIALYVLFNLLSILFSLFSLAMLGPFLQLLFYKEKLMDTAPTFHFSQTESSIILNTTSVR
jgi:subfamily B ATP-binding cassette protein MsbA